MAGRQLHDPGEGRAAGGRVAVGQVVMQRGPVDGAAGAGVTEQRLDLRGEDERAPHPASSRAASCPAGRGPGTAAAAARPRWRTRTCRAGAPRIAHRRPPSARRMTSVSLWVRKRWPRACSSARSGAEVVDLAVEDDPGGAVVARHRLLAGDEVDDRQPRHAERHAVAGEGAAVVGAAMLERREHRVERVAPGRTAHDAGDAAHQPALVDSAGRTPAVACSRSTTRPAVRSVVK